MLGNKCAVLIDKFDFSTAFFNTTTEHLVAEKDSTTYNADATSAEPGLSSDKMSLRGYYSGYQAAAVFKELSERLGMAGRNTCMAVLIDTTDANCLAECHPNAWGKSLKVTLAAPELITFEMNTADNAEMATGLRVLDATISATGNQTPVDFGAAGVDGGAVFIFVQVVGGSVNNASIKVQSATTSDGTYSDKTTLDVDNVGCYHALMTGTVNRWVRVNVANMGGAMSLKVVVVACVKGVTY